MPNAKSLKIDQTDIRQTHSAATWSRSKTLRLVLCLLVSSICLYLAVRGMDFARTAQELRQSSPTPILGAVLFLFLSFWIRAWRWHYLLAPIKDIPVRPLFRSTLIGFMGNYLLPFRAGEIMRAVSIGQTQGISKSAALGSIVLERVFDGVVISLTPFLVLTAVELPLWVTRINFALLAIYITSLVALVLATQRGWTETWIEKALAVAPVSFAHRAGPLATQFLQGMKGITHSRGLLPISLLSLACWVIHAMYFFLMFKALDLDLSFSVALVLQMVIGIGVILPAAPGYVGTFEYFTVLGLALFDIGREAAFAYSLLAHVCQFVPVSAVGLFFALRNGFHRLGSEPAGHDERFEVLGSTES
jgi:glycosyltransferase 2 family protein